jgi:uncharacterized membrane protein
MPSSVEQKIEEEYHVSWYIIIYKLLFGLVEFLLGAGITLFGKMALLWYQTSTAQELSEDPHDLVVHLTQGFVPGLLSHNTFLALYLIILGGAKIAGAVGLIYKKNWGVDLLIGLTVVMFPFQFVQLILHPSLADFLYILIGILIALYLVNFKPNEWAKRMSAKIPRKFVVSR